REPRDPRSSNTCDDNYIESAPTLGHVLNERPPPHRQQSAHAIHLDAVDKFVCGCAWKTRRHDGDVMALACQIQGPLPQADVPACVRRVANVARDQKKYSQALGNTGVARLGLNWRLG